MTSEPAVDPRAGPSGRRLFLGETSRDVCPGWGFRAPSAIRGTSLHPSTTSCCWTAIRARTSPPSAPPGSSRSAQADGREHRQEHDRQGRVSADRRDRVALRAHPRRSLALARRPPTPSAAPPPDRARRRCWAGWRLNGSWRKQRKAAGKPSDRPEPGLRPGAGVLAQIRALFRRRAARDSAEAGRASAAAPTQLAELLRREHDRRGRRRWASRSPASTSR